MAEAKAVLRNCQSSPRKMRYVADVVRGMNAEKALYMLQYNAKHASKDIGKLLRSAIDNWEKQNEGTRVEDAQLIVKTVFVDGGKMLKRWLPAPHGRAYKKRKRSNHVTIIVDSKMVLIPEDKGGKSVPETAVADSSSAGVNTTPKKSRRRRKKEIETVAS
ncbi:MAG: 50S ribosomal protein L22 [Chitinophagales bacterium]|nr:50S ribosomal protein L22 [Chitinophagales bacterium]